jgi:serine/threonine protein kinase
MIDSEQQQPQADPCSPKAQKAASIIMEFSPYGDFIEVMNKVSLSQDEKLCRTYFHQLVEGLDALHRHGIAHLDLKCENLLLGADFQLKISDFDLSSKIGSGKIFGRGSTNSRAPELVSTKYQEFQKADVYSAGVCLFLLRAGYRPYLEMKGTTSQDLWGMLLSNDASERQEFWDNHEDLCKSNGVQLSSEFKQLFEAMTRADPTERLSIHQIKQSKWYNGAVYTNEQLKALMGHKYSQMAKCSRKSL